MASAVVVGASGAIGRALVEGIVQGGGYDPVYALSRAALKPAAGAVWRPIDLTDESSIAAAAARIGESGPVGLVIVASGVLHGPGFAPEKSLSAIDPAALATVMAINAIGPALVAKHFVPLLPRRGRAVFAALSARVGSIADNRLGGWYAYRASKAALNQILRTLAIEVARTRPDAVVAGLHPGTVASDLSRPFRSTHSNPPPITPQESAAHLLRVLEGLGPDAGGRCYAWDGSVVPF